ncbi:hypothetical protein [Paenibacillus tyrfis]|uniref:Uncharacterized protein n=1 Tax=Paenibacillus tyrfis TaxID=1501230 RepID=A0A081P7M4_9BACL|nr:hypothetical protein [Paenibacillus tyrfis]KEQ26697.1 hypothetical protein ET33_33215 [Paenibacillus tyrfis]
MDDISKWLILLLAAAVTFPSGSQTARADQKPAEQKLAEPSAMPYITLLDDFKLYASDKTKPNEILGSISAYQSVKLAPIESDRLLDITRMDKVPVETWLGKAWINLKEGAYKYGQLQKQEQTLTLLDLQTPLYDSRMKVTGYSLSPQQVQAVASIDACDPYTPCRTSAKWHLIATSWLGEQWIRSEHYAEYYEGVGQPVDGMIPIARESEVYSLPFEKPLADEPKLPPQVLKPVEKYTRQARMVPPSVWYQVETPNGLRWIRCSDDYGLGIEGLEQVDRKLDIPVSFHYYQTPLAFSSDPNKTAGEQPAQTVQVIGKKGSWYFTVSEGVGKWINPSMEIASRLTGDFEQDAKLGVQLSSERLELTGSSIGFDIPYVENQPAEKWLTFTPQTVTASRVWKSPNGESWYYIHTWQGAKWVKP